MSMRSSVGVMFTVVAVWVSWSQPSSALAQTSKAVPAAVKRQIRDIDKSILSAGQLFKKEKFGDSAKIIKRAQSAMVKLTELADANTIDAATLTYRKLAKAHELLTSKGQKLGPLSPLPEPKAAAAVVSFVSQVAPILLSKCGNCHVGQRKGNFNLATFKNLDNSAMIAYGVADESRFIEVIESGEMPPNNRKVSKAELAVLKEWVNAGANFDGKDPNANIASFSAPMSSPEMKTAMVTAPMKPTGDETVSFGLHIAPILLENCASCHISRRPSGNFNMANFAAMVRGGEGGKPYLPGRSATSEIILRMKGEDRDVMPPSGKLDDKLIALVGKWIDEGAKFEPADVQLPLRSVAAKGLAGSLDHEQLTKYRKDGSQETWRLALANLKPSEAVTDNFLVVGTGSTKRLKDIGIVAEVLADRAAKILNSPSDQPYVKGDTTLFVVDKRYDFSEFGRMVEKRNYAKLLVSSWQSDTATANIVLLCGIRDVVDDYEVSLARDIASVQVANWDASIPRWFADGMGYWVASKMFRRDPIIKQWQSESVIAMGSMKKAGDFLGNNMAADYAALVGYRFVEVLQGNSRQFKLLMKGLREDGNFSSAFYNSYGTTPEAYFKTAK